MGNLLPKIRTELPAHALRSMGSTHAEAIGTPARLPEVRSLVIVCPLSDQHLTAIGGIRSLTSLEINGEDATAVGLRELRALSGMESLVLHRIDASVLSWLEPLTQLRRLHIDAITSRRIDFEALARCNLKELVLGGSYPVFPDDVKPLGRCAGLEFLGLEFPELENATLAFLPSLANLSQLRVGGLSQETDHVEWAGHLSTLEAVQFAATPTAGPAVAVINALPELNQIEFCQPMDASILREFDPIPAVHDLAVRENREDGFSEFWRFPGLRSLELRCATTLDGLEALVSLESLCLQSLQGRVDASRLEQLTHLRRLALAGARPEGMSWSTFPVLPQLASLQVDSGWADLPFSIVPKLFPNLEEITLEAGFLAQGDLASLQQLPRLHTVRLSYTQGLSNERVKEVSVLRSLVELRLSGDEISDDSLAPISTLPHLKTLSICSPRITDGGIDYLRAMVQLEKLDVSRTRISWQGISRLGDTPRLAHIRLMARPEILASPYAQRVTTPDDAGDP